MVGGSLRVFRLNSSTTKTGRHDIAEILLKVALSTINQIRSIKEIMIGTLRSGISYQQRDVLHIHVMLQCFFIKLKFTMNRIEIISCTHLYNLMLTATYMES